MDSSRFRALCDLNKITEEQFLLREFGIRLEYGAFDQHHRDGIKIIVSDNPKKWVKLIDSAPDKSITFILIGNETYESDKFEFLNNFPSINVALLYNPPRKASYTNLIKSFFGNLLDGGFIPTALPGSVFRDFRNSQFTRRKINSTQINYKYYELPQGYCNSFVFQISNLSPEIKMYLDSNSSLFTAEFRATLKKYIYKSQMFSYIGQDTNHRRATCLRIARKLYDVETPSKVGFGGLDFDGDNTYLEKLMSAKFPLVPPGSFNNYNHRYTESLITMGLPVILAQNSLDPSENSNWTNNLKFPQSHSFRFLMKFLSTLPTTNFEKIYREAYEKELSRIEAARDFFFLHQD